MISPYFSTFQSNRIFSGSHNAIHGGLQNSIKGDRNAILAGEAHKVAGFSNGVLGGSVSLVVSVLFYPSFFSFPELILFLFSVCR
jgi:hypothetical protein